ncbi:MAG: hypothetical protein COB85_07570, partial [Bacteroidetes bacterium]
LYKCLTLVFLSFQYSVTFAQPPQIDSLIDQLGEAEAFHELGNYERDENKNFTKAMGWYQKSLELVQKTDSVEDLAMLFNSIGLSYKADEDPENALRYLLKSLKTCEEHQLKKLALYPLGNIGGVYERLKNFKKAEEYYVKSYEASKIYGTKKSMLIDLNNLGNATSALGKFKIARKYYLEALVIANETNDKSYLAHIANNLGAIAFLQQNYEKAISYFRDALKIREEMGEQEDIPSCWSNIGETYEAMGNPHKALEYLTAALELAQEINSLSDIMNTSEVLSRVHESIGNYKSALQYHHLSTELQDSLFSIENQKQITEMQTKYETEKKEKEIKLLSQEKQLQAAELKENRIMLFVFAGGFLMVVMFSFLLYNRFRITHRQKKIIQKQKEVVDEKNKDITDSIRYAEQIQHAILPPEEYCTQTLSDHFILFRPKDIVSGDFYWVHETLSGKVIWVAADCTGHGVPGAFMSMIGNSLLNEIVVEKGITTPGKIFDELKAGIISALGQTDALGQSKDGMDASLCVWNKKNNQLEFAGAYNPLYLLRKDAANSNLKNKGFKFHSNDLAELKADRQPIAFEEGKDAPFTTHQIQLEEGDSVYTFSDGFQDQFGGPKGKKFTAKRLKEMLLSIQEKTMPEQKLILNETIEEWKGEDEQIDDIVVIGVRI